MSSFYVTLLSNNENINHQEYHNTLSKFYNVLQETINFDGASWWFSLQSVFCHNEFKSDRSEFIKIKCDLLTAYDGQENVIGLIARPKAKNGYSQSLYYEPEVREYFPVNQSAISRIGIQIEAVNDKNLYTTEANTLLSGQPTVVVLKFKQRPKMNPTVVRVNSGKDFNPGYEQNKAYSFTCLLGTQYAYNPNDANYEAALSSITYQPDFKLTSEEHVTVKEFNPNEPSELLKTYKVPPFIGQTNDQFLHYINEVVLKEFGTIPDPTTNKLGVRNKITADIVMDDDGIYRIQLWAGVKSLIQLPYSLMFNLGERSFVPRDGISLKDASEVYSYKIFINKNQAYKFQAGPNPFAFFPDMGFLYCDFIKETYVGSRSGTVLRSFPISMKKHNQDYVTYSVKNPEYYPLSKYDLTTVSFQLRDVTGNFLPFKNPDSNVIVNFIIRMQPTYGTIKTVRL